MLSITNRYYLILPNTKYLSKIESILEKIDSIVEGIDSMCISSVPELYTIVSDTSVADFLRALERGSFSRIQEFCVYTGKFWKYNLAEIWNYFICIYLNKCVWTCLHLLTSSQVFLKVGGSF